jgi:hypothetical protein
VLRMTLGIKRILILWLLCMHCTSTMLLPCHIRGNMCNRNGGMSVTDSLALISLNFLCFLQKYVLNLSVTFTLILPIYQQIGRVQIFRLYRPIAKSVIRAL